MKEDISRRDFIRIASEGAALAGATALAGACAPKETAAELARKEEDPSAGKMEMRSIWCGLKLTIRRNIILNFLKRSLIIRLKRLSIM